MNILFLYSGSIDPIKGGIERVTYVLASWFETKGFHIYFLGLERNYLTKDARQYYLPNSNLFCTKENKRYFLSFLKKNTIDIVINQGGLGPQSSELAYYCRQLNVRLISVIHNSLLASIKNFASAYQDRFQHFGLKWLLPITNYILVKKILLYLYKIKYKNHYTALCKNSDIVVLLSDKFKEELLFFTKIPVNTRVIGIPNPVSFMAAADNNNFQYKKKELLYVGRIDFSQKRVDLLLEIWSKLHQKFPDWSLCIVGGGKDLSRAIQLSSKLYLKNIFFEDFQDPQRFYQNASLFCMTSSYEGFGIVLVEAMQHGVIPFAFNSFLSITDIIDDQVNGVLISPFNTDIYSSELQRFMLDNNLHSQFSKAAVIKSKEFSLDKIGNKWLSLFDDLKTRIIN